MKGTLRRLFAGSMRGRTLYVIPFSMGPVGSPYSHIGVELSDSPYVAASMRIMTRMGRKVLAALGDGDFVPCLHSVGVPLAPGQADVPWPCNRGAQVHRPLPGRAADLVLRERLRRQCAARQEVLRAAHRLGPRPGAGVARGAHADPGGRVAEGREDVCGRGLPERVRQDELRHAHPAEGVRGLEGHDGGRRHRLDEARRGTGRLYAINPEAGYFGVAPGTSEKSNANAMATIRKGTIFTNVGLTARRRRVVGRDDRRAARRSSSTGRGSDWTPGLRAARRRTRTRASRRLRRAVSVDRCALGRSERVCPSAAFIFGGRRATTMPLVVQSFNWSLGVYPAATMGSEMTAAAAGTVGQVRRDPMAMLPFCGYHMGDYFNHWLSIGRQIVNPPRIFAVNWFRKDDRRQLPLAGLRREHARAQVDRRPRARPRLRGWRARSAGCRATKTSSGGAWTASRRSSSTQLMAVDREAWKVRVRLARGALRAALRPAAQGDPADARAAPVAALALARAVGLAPERYLEEHDDTRRHRRAPAA